MTDLNTQEDQKGDVNVSSTPEVNKETSNNNSSIEIDVIKEEMKQQNSTLKNLEELIRSRKDESKEEINPVKSIMEDSIIDPEKASKNLDDYIQKMNKKTQEETIKAIRMEQEVNSAISSVITKNQKLVQFIEDIKFKAGSLIRAGQATSIQDAISKAADVYNKAFGVPEGKVEKKTDSNAISEGHVGKTHSVSTTIDKGVGDEVLTPEQEIDAWEEARLSKVI